MKKKTGNSDFYKMFTGIIEAQGKILTISSKGTNKTFQIASELARELKVDQSLSHDGVCLTVESVSPESYSVTAIEETLIKSNLREWRTGGFVNLERSLQMNGRLDGHIVQGHVDTTACCVERKNIDGSWLFRFEFPELFSKLIIEKGSVAVNGISLTCFDVTKDRFSVAIIPYTFEHTNIRNIDTKSIVNIEFDMIGKYVERILKFNSPV
jgi:riboflavin synthase